ncbi:MAG: hypothetical protein KJO46_02235 [Gammaproteobacteria bacterium]|nr:hypothetical protein [Gammaproteobacteria bacterium]
MSSSLQILTAGVTWRLFGSRRAADVLLEAMNGDDEQQRMLAGMSLVKAGDRSFDLITERALSGDASAPAIRLLPDIGGERSRRILSRLAAGESGDIADAANECIDLLDRVEELDKG